RVIFRYELFSSNRPAPRTSAAQVNNQKWRHRMNRREFIGRHGLLLASLSLATAIPAYAVAQDGKVTLKFLGWQGYDDAKAMGPLAEKITIDAQYITGNAEIVTKLRSGGM